MENTQNKKNRKTRATKKNTQKLTTIINKSTAINTYKSHVWHLLKYIQYISAHNLRSKYTWSAYNMDTLKTC